MVKNDKRGASQIDRFIETARALGCDEDKERFEAALGKIVKADVPSKARKEAGSPSAKREGKKRK